MDIVPYLRKNGYLSAERLQEAMKLQRELGIWLGEILIDNGWVAERYVYEAVASEKALPFVDVDMALPDPIAVELVSKAFATRHSVLPMRSDANTNVLWVAIVDADDLRVVEELRETTHRSIRPLVAGPYALERAIRRAYQQTD